MSMSKFSTPDKMVPELSTPPKLYPPAKRSSRLIPTISDPKTPSKQWEVQSCVAEPGSPSPSLASTLVLGQTPPRTPLRADACMDNGEAQGEASSGSKGPEGVGVPVGTPSSTFKTTPKDKVKGKETDSAAGDWTDRYDLNLLSMMCADSDSETDVPVNVRLITRVNKLRLEYRELVSYNNSYKARTESWPSFRDGSLRGTGWFKEGSKWQKEGAMPPVELPKKVKAELKEKEPGLLMSMQDIRYLMENKKKSPMKSMKATSMKKPPSKTAKGSPKSKAIGASPIKKYFNKGKTSGGMRKPAAASSSSGAKK